MKKERFPLRILNVFGRMDRGGAETGTLQVLRRIDKSKFQYDFLTLKEGQGYFDDEIKKYSSKIYQIKYSKNLIIFYNKFKNLINKIGPYSIIHSRVHHYSGFILFMAKRMGIPIRIAHSHSATPPTTGINKIIRMPYFIITKLLIKKYATAGLAVSKVAANSLFGKEWDKNPKFHIIYTGIDLTPFKNPLSNISKKALGLPDNSIVIGHVGSFREAKNHPFLIEIMEELLKLNQHFHLLLCGEGQLSEKIKTVVQLKGMDKNIHFLGLREDIPQLMLNVMDIFVLPSIYEGLPHVGVEAQAAGLPVIFSEKITREVNIIKSLVQYLPIDKGAQIWASAIMKRTKNINRTKLPEAYKLILNTEFDVNIGTKKLLDFYLNEYENYLRTRS